MSNVKLNTLNTADTQDQLTDKSNYNFHLLADYINQVRGIEGPRGKQGLPGIQGPRGFQGDTGKGIYFYDNRRPETDEELEALNKWIAENNIPAGSIIVFRDGNIGVTKDEDGTCVFDKETPIIDIKSYVQAAIDNETKDVVSPWVYSTDGGALYPEKINSDLYGIFFDHNFDKSNFNKDYINGSYISLYNESSGEDLKNENYSAWYNIDAINGVSFISKTDKIDSYADTSKMSIKFNDIYSVADGVIYIDSKSGNTPGFEIVSVKEGAQTVFATGAGKYLNAVSGYDTDVDNGLVLHDLNSEGMYIGYNETTSKIGFTHDKLTLCNQSTLSLGISMKLNEEVRRGETTLFVMNSYKSDNSPNDIIIKGSDNGGLVSLESTGEIILKSDDSTCITCGDKSRTKEPRIALSSQSNLSENPAIKIIGHFGQGNPRDDISINSTNFDIKSNRLNIYSSGLYINSDTAKSEISLRSVYTNHEYIYQIINEQKSDTDSNKTHPLVFKRFAEDNSYLGNIGGSVLTVVKEAYSNKKSDDDSFISFNMPILEDAYNDDYYSNSYKVDTGVWIGGICTYIPYTAELKNISSNNYPKLNESWKYKNTSFFDKYGLKIASEYLKIVGSKELILESDVSITFRCKDSSFTLKDGKVYLECNKFYINDYDQYVQTKLKQNPKYYVHKFHHQEDDWLDVTPNASEIKDYTGISYFYSYSKEKNVNNAEYIEAQCLLKTDYSNSDSYYAGVAVPTLTFKDNNTIIIDDNSGYAFFSVEWKRNGCKPKESHRSGVRYIGGFLYEYPEDFPKLNHEYDLLKDASDDWITKKNADNQDKCYITLSNYNYSGKDYIMLLIRIHGESYTEKSVAGELTIRQINSEITLS